MSFEPKIVGFMCNWCAYSGADLAGVSRIQSSPNVRVVRTMCTGRIDPVFVLKAFEAGADGVLIGGCHPGDCHYQEGNFKTLRRYLMLKRVLEQFGVDPRRLRLEWISAAEAEKFARVTLEMTEEVRALGPFHLEETRTAASPSPATSGQAQRKEVAAL